MLNLTLLGVAVSIAFPPVPAGLTTSLVPVVPTNTVSVDLVWDPSATPTNELSGYALYQGLSSTTLTNRTFVTNLSLSVLAEIGKTNWFFVVAVGTNSLESDPSNTLLYTPQIPEHIYKYTLQNFVSSNLWTNIGSIQLTNPPGDYGIFRVQLEKLTP